MARSTSQAPIHYTSQMVTMSRSSSVTLIAMKLYQQNRMSILCLVWIEEEVTASQKLTRLPLSRKPHVILDFIADCPEEFNGNHAMMMTKKTRNEEPSGIDLYSMDEASTMKMSSLLTPGF